MTKKKNKLVDREIEFRAWDKKREEWFYFVIEATDKNRDYTISFGSPMHLFILRNDECDLQEYQQYTGLKDRNGEKIFEGDIIKVKYYPYDNDEVEMTLKSDWIEFNAKVIFKNGSFWAAADCKYRQLFLTMFETKEVIGNIYENPNLLKSKNENTRKITNDRNAKRD